MYLRKQKKNTTFCDSSTWWHIKFLLFWPVTACWTRCKKNGGTTNLIFQLISLEFGVFVVKIFNNHCTKMQINRVVRADFTSIKIRGRSFRCMQISSTKWLDTFMTLLSINRFHRLWKWKRPKHKCICKCQKLNIYKKCEAIRLI